MLLGADGHTYRRLDEAESLSIPEDQGDPAVSVLSADGTFVVIGSAGRTGEVHVVTLRDGHRRVVPIGADRTALPISIGADGRTVLLATKDGVVNRYGEGNDLGLARLDLETGQVVDLPALTDVDAAALSPDGSRILATTRRGAEVVDTSTGRVTATVPTPFGVYLDGDAWSPDGSKVALMDEKDLLVVDPSAARIERRLPLSELAYGTAIGWRDDSTALVHGTTDTSANTSSLYWVDVTTGEQTPVASYRPNFTGAALIRADAARDLVPGWQVEPQPVDRGPLPLVPGVSWAVAAGLLAAGITRLVQRYRTHTV